MSVMLRNKQNAFYLTFQHFYQQQSSSSARRFNTYDEQQSSSLPSKAAKNKANMKRKSRIKSG